MSAELGPGELDNIRRICREHPKEPDWFGTTYMSLVLARLDAAEARVLALREALTAVVADEPKTRCNGDCHGWASPGPCGACATPVDYARAALAEPAS